MPKYELIQNHIFQQSVQHNYQNYFDRIHVLNSGKIFIDVSNFFFNNIAIVNVRFFWNLQPSVVR